MPLDFIIFIFFSLAAVLIIKHELYGWAWVCACVCMRVGGCWIWNWYSHENNFVEHWTMVNGFETNEWYAIFNEKSNWITFFSITRDSSRLAHVPRFHIPRAMFPKISVLYGIALERNTMFAFSTHAKHFRNQTSLEFNEQCDHMLWWISHSYTNKTASNEQRIK